MNKKINIGIEELKIIFHISDIHIRNVYRHKEYREVFKKVYSEIKKDTKDAICVVAGDIVHAKLEMSPELVDLTFEFFNNLSNILPTVVITGNHDTNLNNKSRMDALTPIIKNIKNNNIHYLRESGIYEIADAKFVVMSVFDNPKNYIQADSFDGDTKIAMYHGIVNQAISDTGFVLHDDRVQTNLFNGYDMVLLGDIHKYQTIQEYNKKKRLPQIEYPGSLLQQRHSEDVKKGFIKWDVKNRKPEFIEIPNKHAFITLNVVNGVMPDISHLTSNARIRIKHENTPASRLIEIVTQIREAYPKIDDVTDMKINSIIDSNDNDIKIDIGDMRDVKFQNELIRDFLTKHHPFEIDNKTMTKIFELNKELNLKIPPREVARDIVWKPTSFEFSNMFSYGTNNSVDFTKLKGVTGLFAPNASGKSNLIDALTFTIFDKSPRAWKAINVMNNKKHVFKSKFKFTINNNEYEIERDARRKKNDDVTVKTNFCVTQNGVKSSLNGDQRKETNKNIRLKIGDYEDFSLTALMPQTTNEMKNNNFISMRQSDRKELLSRFLDSSIFQNLYEMANDEIRVVSAKLREFERREFSKEMSELVNELKKLEVEYKEKSEKRTDYTKIYKRINQEIKKLTGKLITIDSSIVDLNKLTTLKNDIENKMLLLNENIQKTSSDIITLEKEITFNTDEFNKINPNIEDKFNIVTEIKKQQYETQNNYDKYKIKLDSQLNQLGEYNNFVFDESCDSCAQNKQYIQSKFDNKDNIEDQKNFLNLLKDKLNNFEKMINKAKGTEELYSKYQSLKNRISDFKNQYTQLENLRIKHENELAILNQSFKETENKINLYYKNEKNIKKNQELQTKIDDWESKLTVVDGAMESINDSIMKLHGKIEINKQKQETINNEMDYFKKLETESNAYKYYMKAIERDGVPFLLISRTIPLIETEINNILSQIVDFKILFDVSQESKDIYPKIVYDDENYWPIELVSGMERFISSVAIRVALIRVSNLPKTNFMVIDEGFGVLDQTNMNELVSLFEYLRSQFDFIFIISHIDTIKDMVDTQVEINKIGGYSKINF